MKIKRIIIIKAKKKNKTKKNENPFFSFFPGYQGRWITIFLCCLPPKVKARIQQKKTRHAWAWCSYIYYNIVELNEEVFESNITGSESAKELLSSLGFVLTNFYRLIWVTWIYISLLEATKALDWKYFLALVLFGCADFGVFGMVLKLIFLNSLDGKAIQKANRN